MSSVRDEDRGYNGWANYETWVVNLWIGNDEGSHDHWQGDQARQVYADAVREQLREWEFDPGEDPRDTIDREKATDEAAQELAGRLKQELDDGAELPRLLDGTVYADLLNAALGEVDWHEIARTYVEDCDRDDVEQEVAEGYAVEADDDPDEEAAGE